MAVQYGMVWYGTVTVWYGTYRCQICCLPFWGRYPVTPIQRYCELRQKGGGGYGLGVFPGGGLTSIQLV